MRSAVIVFSSIAAAPFSAAATAGNRLCADVPAQHRPELFRCQHRLHLALKPRRSNHLRQPLWRHLLGIIPCDDESPLQINLGRRNPLSDCRALVTLVMQLPQVMPEVFSTTTASAVAPTRT